MKPEDVMAHNIQAALLAQAALKEAGHPLSRSAARRDLMEATGARNGKQLQRALKRIARGSR